MNLAFFITAAIAIIATVLVITARNAVHALLYLVMSLLAVAVVFLLLGAPFAAALEVIIYAGAIMVLFLFVVMMTDAAPVPGTAEGLRNAKLWIGPAVLAAVLLAELSVLLALGLPSTSMSASPRALEPARVGATLLGPYLLAMELASMLLLAGLVGAWHLGRPTECGEPGPRPSAPKEASAT